MDCEQSVLELIDIYADLIEKQGEIIHQLVELLRKQSVELQHLKNINGYLDGSELDETTRKLLEQLNNY